MYNGAHSRLAWPVVVRSSDCSVTDEQIESAIWWWEVSIEDFIGCDENPNNSVLCVPGVQLIYHVGLCEGMGPGDVVFADDIDASWVDITIDEAMRPGRLGYTSWSINWRMCPYRANITINPEQSARSFRRTLRHEIGHILSLEHDSSSIDVNSIMGNPYIGQHGELRDNDAAWIVDQVDGDTFCR